MRKILNDCIKKAHEDFKEDRSEVISHKIPDIASETIRSYFERSKTSFPKQKHLKTNKKMGKFEVSRGEKDDFLLKLKKMKIVVAPTNTLDPEAFFDKRSNTIKINTSHPLYKISQSKGRLWGIAYHSIKASIVAMAIEMANDLEEFKEIYDNMARESESRLKDITWAKLMKKQ